jgi:predicted NBD/HSP70 family sugar kinase
MPGKQTETTKHSPPTNVRAVNRAAVLGMLSEFGSLSRAEIARRSGLSEGAVSRITAELIRERLLVEHGAENSTGGRPAVRLELNPTSLTGVAVEIQNWETRMCFGQVNGRTWDTTAFRTHPNPFKTLDLVAEQIEEGRRRLSLQHLEGVGISLRGVVNNETGVVEIGSSPAWTKLAIRDYLEQKLSIPVCVENNVRCAAMAEFRRANAGLRSSRCLIYVKVDEGVGMGIILDGKMYRGPRMAAGEFGQMVVADSPGAGAMDRPGSLEMVASDPAICQSYAEKSGSVKNVSGESAARVRRICHAAREGEQAAIDALREACRYLGIGIANLIWGLDADVVVIDGAITEGWPIASQAVLEQFPTGHDYFNFRGLSLRPSSLGRDASLIGALGLPFQQLFQTGQRQRVEVKRGAAV